ncbi:MAG: DUF1080 domain-containing protein [Catalinimonas sp.]
MHKPYCLALVVMLTACGGQNTKSATNDEATVPADTTGGEWVTLFDGTSTDQWRNYRQDTLSDKWRVEGETLTLTERGGGDIITQGEYEDFELELEWKISEAGNSGIFFHVVEADTLDAVYLTGPEMQILDDERHPDAKRGRDGNRTAGANYDLTPPSRASKPAGEWNRVRLVVDDGRVEHYLNGERVVAYELWSDEWNEMVAASKFGKMPTYGKARRGHIALQDHGDRVWFRNVRIREL